MVKGQEKVFLPGQMVMYRSDFIDGEKSGKGVETLDNGMTYKGSFVDVFVKVKVF